MSPDQYEVAIPSHARRATLALRTLPLLLRRGVDPERITVVCSSDLEAEQYAATLPKNAYRRISVAAPTVSAARKHIAHLYPAGTPVVMADDDIYEVHRALDKKQLVPVENLHQLFVDGFTGCRRVGAYLWGISPVNNAFYMRPGQTSTGLKFILGTLCGFWSRGGDHFVHQLDVDEKDDYERTLRFFEHDRVLFRFDDVAVKTRFYKEPGGMQTYRTVEHSHLSAHVLQKRWPQWVHINQRRAGPRSEIVLRESKQGAA